MTITDSPIPPDHAALQSAILDTLQALDKGHTLNATDIARTLATDADWHTLLTPVRRAAVALALDGRLVIYRKGKPVDPADFKGVYRFGLPRHD